MNKKLKATAAVCAVVMALTAASVTASADYSCKDTDEGKTTTYTWDFAEYTTEQSFSSDFDSVVYDGLTIMIAGNDKDSDHDKVSSGGVYWRGGASSGDTSRYIAYTPTFDGKLTVTGEIKSSDGRWGISTSKTVTSFNGTDGSSTNETGSKTVSMNCAAGTTYYIYAKAVSATVTKVEYVADTVQSFTFETKASDVSDKTLYVTVGDVTKDMALKDLLKTTTVSGEAELKLGIDFTYTTGREITAAYIQ